MTNINHPLNTLFIRIDSPNTTTASLVWNYFGQLYKEPNELLDKERVYCRLCLDRLKEKYPSTSFSSVRSRIGDYKSTSGTGNMKNHLLAVHQVTGVQETNVTKTHVLSMFSRGKSSVKISQRKQQLGHQLTLMCCRDLLPFSIVENEGVILWKLI